MSLRDEDSLREAVTPHSPQPTAVSGLAAARPHAADEVTPLYNWAMRRPSTRRLIVLIFVLAAASGAALLIRAWAWPGPNTLVGRSESAVRARYGTPEHEFSGHYGLPAMSWAQQFGGEIKSGVFWRLRGRVYVTFEKRGGQWVVISNQYLPNGAAF